MRYDSSYWNPGFYSYLKILGTIVTHFFEIYIEMLVIRMSINSNSSTNYIYISFYRTKMLYISQGGVVPDSLLYTPESTFQE